MKKYFFTLTILLLGVRLTYSQSVAVNTDGSKPNPNAIVDVKSTTKGVLLPRMSTDQRQNIPNTRGLLVYDTSTNLFWFNTGTDWLSLITSSFNPGFENTADGLGALGANIDGGSNSAFGFQALSSSPSGGLNTAIGANALTSNTSGIENTAVGAATLLFNTTGSFNTASGALSMGSSTTGNANTANGFRSLHENTTGSFNTADGDAALSKNTSGNQNTANGDQALILNTVGNNNTAGGFAALASNTFGNNLTAFGTHADVSKDGLTNSTAIGNGAIVNHSNKVRIGNTAVTVIEGQVHFTTPSDGRFKFNIKENVKGLDFILKLRPVTYQFDVKKQENFTKGVIKPNQLNTYISSIDNDEATQMIRTGFIAQEVEEAAKKADYTFDGVNAPKTESEYYSLSYSSFVVPLVKAVQEQQQIISKQQQKLEDQNKRIDNLESELAENKEEPKVAELIASVKSDQGKPLNSFKYYT